MLKHNRSTSAEDYAATLINSYPDSEYIARAKLAVGKIMVRREVGEHRWRRPEIEYKDFGEFLPQNARKLAEAKLKMPTSKYQQIGKEGPRFTHDHACGRRKYRQLILQYPDQLKKVSG